MKKRYLMMVMIGVLSILFACFLLGCGPTADPKNEPSLSAATDFSSVLDAETGLENVQVKDVGKTISFSLGASASSFDFNVLSSVSGLTVTVYSDSECTKEVKGIVGMEKGDNIFYVCASKDGLSAVYKLTITSSEDATSNPEEPAHEHTFGAWETVTQATCTQKGLKKRTCSCGEEETEEIPALGHDLIHHDGKEPTCTESGWNGYDTCSRCEYTTYEEIAPFGHQYDEDGVCTICRKDEPRSAEGLAFVLRGDTYEVSGYTGSDTEVIILGAHNGKAVTSIGRYAFDNCSSLTSITIPDSVTSVGSYAFYYCSSLTSITIPDSVTSIGVSAFSDCSSLTSVMIGNSVTSIGNSAFYNCSSLTSVTLGNGVTSIGDSAFYNCSRLTSVYYTGDIASWGGITFNGDYYSNPLSYAHNLYINNELIKDIVIPDTVTEIKKVAFYGWNGTSITIPDSVTSIGDNAFSGCYKLVEVYNKSALSITKGSSENGHIGYYAKDIYTEEYTSKLSTDSNGYVIYTDGEEKILIGYTGEETELTLPDGITEINQCAFWSCSSLTSITFGNGVTSIGDNAFSGCSGLTSITIPDSVTSIGSSAFSGCPIETATIPAIACTYIKNNALQSVTITSGTSIPDSAFSGCSSLTSITIPDSVTSIGDNAFQSCSSLTSITLGNGVTSIGDNAFSGCSSLTSITIPDSVTSIGSSAFEACSSLTSITFGNGVTSIGDNAFSGCSGLTSIIIPDSVTSIGNSAFSGCPIETATIPAIACTYIKNNALQSVTITSGTSIPDSAFYNCSLLTSITIPDSVTSIGEDAFFGCSSLTSITIPNSVTSIGDNAFYGCYKLVEVYNKSALSITKGSSENGWCSELYERNISGYNGTRANVKYDDCNPFGMIAGDFGEITSLSKHATKSASDSTIVAFNSLSELFATFMGYFEIPTDGTEYIPTISSDALNAYTQFYNKAIELYNGSLVSFTKNISNDLTRSAVIGVNHPYTMTFGTDVSPEDINFQTVIANLFGFSSETEFMDYAQNLANTYDQHRTNITNSTATNEALENGCFYTSNGSFVFPIAVKNELSSTVLAYVILDTSGLVSVWVNDITAALWTTNFNVSYHTDSIINNELYCKNILFVTGPENGYIGYYAENVYTEENGSKLSTDENGYILYTDEDEVSLIGYTGTDTQLTLPSNVTEINSYGFYGKSEITSITIPDSVTSIGDWAFSGCSSLTSVTIPDSVTSIGSSALSGCPIETATIPAIACSYISKSALKTVVITSGESIGDYAFFDCSSLTSITIPDSVTSIGEYAFYNCGSLTSITIPASVTSIGDYAFSGCSSLTSITIPDGVTSIGERAFSGCSSLTSITISDSITSIEVGVFEGCIGLTSITIPDSVTSIGSSAFSGCDSLTSITIPDSVTSIGDGAFSGCSSLTSITISDGVTSIGDYAFRYCSSLTSITIPDSVTSIGDYAFSSCSSLRYNEYDNGYYLGNNHNPYIVLVKAKDTSITTCTIHEDTKFIYSSAFYNCSRLQYNEYDNGYYLGNNHNPYMVLVKAKDTSITTCTIHEDTKFIYSSAFYNCSSLTSITIPDSVTSIGKYTFWYCSSLTSITIPDGVTSIGEYAFYYCDSLTSITLGNRITSIGYGAFSNCSSLMSITIPDSITSIGDWPFYGCSSLTSITIPDSVTSIGDWAFYGCSSLTSITIPDSVTSIGRSAFSSCRGLTSITIPDGVTSIGNSAFSGCSSLTSITIPDGVTSIGDYAFRYCSSLTSITFEGTKAQWTAISKGGSDWNYNTGSYTIHCTDGDISK